MEALQGSPDEAGGSELFDMTWNKPTLIPTPLGSVLETTPRLLAPNTIRIVLNAREEGITEVRTLIFTGIGIQVQYTYIIYTKCKCIKPQRNLSRPSFSRLVSSPQFPLSNKCNVLAREQSFQG